MGKNFSRCRDIGKNARTRNNTINENADDAPTPPTNTSTSSIRNIKAAPAMIEDVPAYCPLKPEDMYYKMDHKKRGLALIFNHEFFEDDDISPRTGTNVDCEKLTSTLKGFGFEVQHFHDLTYQSISNYLGEVAKMDHSQHDCLVVVVLSHGELGELHAHDRKYNAEIIWSSFTSSNCPSLEGKPRLFFIQACRGDQTDEGIKLHQHCRSETDGHPSVVFRIPTHRDFLIAYSTLPGFYSWRNKKEGSWFVQALCSELDVYGDRLDLLTILTFVCQRVAIDFESYSPERVHFHQKKQMPAVTTMLTRLIKFKIL